MALTPEQRSLRAKAAAHALHANVDPKKHAAPARRGFMARFEREVDPENKLDPAERARRAEHAMRSYMTSLALKRSTKGARKGAGNPSTGREQ